MSTFREQGQISIPANIERKIAAPLDASMRVFTIEGLIHPDTFKSLSDGTNYAYVGMFTSVIGDDIESNNGIYVLTKLPTTNKSNWVKLQDASSGNLTTNSKDVIGAINELNEKIGNYDISNKTELIAGEQAVLNWNSTDKHLQLPLGSVEVFEADVIGSTVNGKVLKQKLTFSSNTLGDLPVISDAIVSYEDSVDIDDFDIHLDLKQDNKELARLTLLATSTIDCSVTIFLTRKTC